jgi:hypothetical protein
VEFSAGYSLNCLIRISSSTEKTVEHFGQRTMVPFDQAQVQPDARTAQIPTIRRKLANLLISHLPCQRDIADGQWNNGMLGKKLKPLNPLFHHSIIPIFLCF